MLFSIVVFVLVYNIQGTNGKQGRYCSPNPCFNGGKCYETDDGFICECPSDFMGKKCEVAMTCNRDLGLVETGHRCRKQCSRDIECGGSMTKCRCDGWCGMSCFNPDAECPPLENPRNGYVVVGNVTYGSVVKYVCNEGYSLVGLDERVCTSSRKWSGLQPTCVDFSECGVTEPLDPTLHNQLVTRRVKRVVGGDDAPDNAWPWQASILVAVVESGNINVEKTLKRWELTTAGTIINKQWILTVTHPVQHMVPKYFYRQSVIVVGVSSRSSVKYTIKDTVQMFKPLKYILHEKFNKTTFENDIGLIKLGERLFPKSTVPFVNIKEITFNAAVRPVCLPCTQKCVMRGWDKNKKCEAEGEFLVKPGIKIVLTGFGTRETDHNIQSFPDRLQQVVLEVGNKKSCQRGINDIIFFHKVGSFDLYNSTFCTVSSVPHKVMTGCYGDGGGPVVRKITQRDGSVCWVQVGISSFGAKCDGTIPEFYTKVASHTNWIEEAMQNN
uniref:coagulation factor IX-like isoform X1 n=1 Tax=Styela clava TaxID=7725 RepID=UPI0019398845|nr:coagulation factor IX-like isoform X1 [Styela clava]